MSQDTSRDMSQPSPETCPHAEREIREKEKITTTIGSEHKPIEDQPPSILFSQPKAVGKNSPEEVARAFDLAEKMFPMSNMGTMCRQWLHAHSAQRVCELMAQYESHAAPSRVIGKVLNSPEEAARVKDSQPKAPLDPWRFVRPPIPSTPAKIDMKRRQEGAYALRMKLIAEGVDGKEAFQRGLDEFGLKDMGARKLPWTG